MFFVPYLSLTEMQVKLQASEARVEQLVKGQQQFEKEKTLANKK